MKLTRRQLIVMGSSTAAVALTAPHALAARSASAWYEGAIVIDGLGSPGNMESGEGAPLSAADIDDVHTSGLTAIHLTVGAVGTMSPLAAFEKIVRDITRWEGEIVAHRDVLAAIFVAVLQLGDCDGATLRPEVVQPCIAFHPFREKREPPIEM